MTPSLIERLRTGNRPLVLSGAGIVGTQVLELCRLAGIRIDGVCDGSAKLADSQFHGHRVIPTARLRQLFPAARVLITVAAIKDVVEVLREQGLTDWIAAGPLLEQTGPDPADVPADELRLAIETCIACHAAYLHPERAFLRSVDLIITERCSLRCRDCANLMQYYPRPHDVDLALLLRSIDALTTVVDEVMELRIIGGDAFMNKRWPRVVAHATANPRIRRVVVYTNGAIVPTAAQAALLADPKVLVLVTDYGSLSRNIGRLQAYCLDHGIAHRCLHVDTWLDCAALEHHGRDAAGNADVFATCCAKNMLSLSDGRLFRCPFAANADRLQAIPDNTGDFVDILSHLDAGESVATIRDRIMAYVRRREPLATCDYCNGRPLAGREVPPAVQVAAPLPYARPSPLPQP